MGCSCRVVGGHTGHVGVRWDEILTDVFDIGVLAFKEDRPWSVECVTVMMASPENENIVKSDQQTY